jgi:hypothetical protein
MKRHKSSRTETYLIAKWGVVIMLVIVTIKYFLDNAEV